MTILNNRVREIDEYTGMGWPAPVRYVVVEHAGWDGSSYVYGKFATRKIADKIATPEFRNYCQYVVEEAIFEQEDYAYELHNTLNRLLDYNQFFKK